MGPQLPNLKMFRVPEAPGTNSFLRWPYSRKLAPLLWHCSGRQRQCIRGVGVVKLLGVGAGSRNVCPHWFMLSGGSSCSQVVNGAYSFIEVCRCAFVCVIIACAECVTKVRLLQTLARLTPSHSHSLVAHCYSSTQALSLTRALTHSLINLPHSADPASSPNLKATERPRPLTPSLKLCILEPAMTRHPRLHSLMLASLTPATATPASVVDGAVAGSQSAGLAFVGPGVPLK